MKITLLVISLFWITSSFASGGFCQRNRQSMYERFGDPHARIDFVNQGGLFNGGVCWWHSRLQRSSLYLARYAPQMPRPSAAQVNGILAGLKAMNQVVLIPGHHNFESFTNAHGEQVQKFLNKWQVEDGTVNMQWLRGISGKSSLPGPELERKMRQLHDVFKGSPMGVWVMAQMRGITSHAFLIRNMEALPSGYVLEVIDSNFPKQLHQVRYQFGDTFLNTGHSANFIPYVGFQEDFSRIRNSLVTFCKANPNAKLAGDEIMGDGPIILGDIEPNL